MEPWGYQNILQCVIEHKLEWSHGDICSHYCIYISKHAQSNSHCWYSSCYACAVCTPVHLHSVYFLWMGKKCNRLMHKQYAQPTHQKVFVVLPIVFRWCSLNLFSYPLFQLCRFQEVLVAIHGLHKPLLAWRCKTVQIAHLLLYHLLLRGNVTRIWVFGSHHGTSSVAHLIHNATICVQLKFNSLKAINVLTTLNTNFSSGSFISSNCNTTRVHRLHQKFIFMCFQQCAHVVQDQILVR